MKYLKQSAIILVITFIGEIIYKYLPLPIPASIYGFLIMLICLQTKIIKLEQVKDISGFLLEIMPVMFIPAAVGIINVWGDVSHVILPVIFIIISTTVIVMVATGKMTDLIINRDRSKN